jgi:hypothetical protein
MKLQKEEKYAFKVVAFVHKMQQNVKKKRPSTEADGPFTFVEVTGLEPAATRPPDVYSTN